MAKSSSSRGFWPITPVFTRATGHCSVRKPLTLLPRRGQQPRDERSELTILDNPVKRDALERDAMPDGQPLLTTVNLLMKHRSW